jgi:hypothetical protein
VDVFDEEILKFWKALQDNSVQYIMVGGYAKNYMATSVLQGILISGSKTL